MKEIKLTQGKVTLVDDKNFEWLNQWKWYLSSKGYAIRENHLGRKNGKSIRETIRMHRLINNTPNGFETDHQDRNKLNNQRNNLKTVTNSQNQINTGLQKNNISGYRGIHWDKKRNKWMAQIKKDGKNINLGGYSNLQGAWLARRLGERIYFNKPVLNINLEIYRKEVNKNA